MDAGTRPQTTGLGRAVWHELPASVRGGGLIDPCQLSTIDVGPSPGTPSGLYLFSSHAFDNAVQRLQQRRKHQLRPVNINFRRRPAGSRLGTIFLLGLIGPGIFQKFLHDTGEFFKISNQEGHLIKNFESH